ncbi:unnamed protein product [Blepharisma stoltei]|uniref:Uncharacterized protein n=1 Tax=Blepharisma stoltei TaxID=1481888 RepID=A0AAU9K3B8_9CILI|nr:unnamed protein product [Blepharisma stoltei]
MDLRTKTVRQIFQFELLAHPFNKSDEIIYYENSLYIFGERKLSGCMKIDLNSKRYYMLPFPILHHKMFCILLYKYVLVANYIDSNLYLYDLMIEEHSIIASFEHLQCFKHLFTDNLRTYLWIPLSAIYESEENNPFIWNLIGNSDFGISFIPSEINYSNYMGNLYLSYITRSSMPRTYCYIFNRKKKEMELINHIIGNN